MFSYVHSDVHLYVLSYTYSIYGNALHFPNPKKRDGSCYLIVDITVP